MHSPLTSSAVVTRDDGLVGWFNWRTCRLRVRV